MTRVALFASAAFVAGTAFAFAQGTVTPPADTKAPSASSSSEYSAPGTAQTAPTQPSPNAAADAGANHPTATAQNPACDRDIANYCSGKVGTDRQNCLEQNMTKLSAACKQSLETQTAPVRP